MRPLSSHLKSYQRELNQRLPARVKPTDLTKLLGSVPAQMERIKAGSLPEPSWDRSVIIEAISKDLNESRIITETFPSDEGYPINPDDGI